MIAPFDWPMPMKGYSWVKGLCDPHGNPFGDVLVPIEDWLRKAYDPGREYPGLFRTLATTSPTRAGIQGFANKFGSLGVTFDLSGYLDGDPVDPDYEQFDSDAARRNWERDERIHFGYADPLYVWKREIKRMADAIFRLDHINAGKATEAEIKFATDACTDMLAYTKVGCVIAFTPRTKKLAMHYRPRCLLALTWCQFALSLTGAQKTRLCPGCSQWFIVSADRGRANQEHCREACRARAYRKRKDDAVRLSTEGLTPSEVAHRIGAKVDQVRKWLRQVRD